MGSGRIPTTADQIKDYQRYIELFAGVVIGVMGFQLFTVPLGFYNGGTVGASQVIRTLAVDHLGLAPGIDLAGPLNLLFNIPLMLLAFRSIGRRFLVRTLFCMAVQTAAISFLHVSQPLITDPLTACLIGGILGGAGVGIILRAGGSTAGFDILGVWLAQRIPLGVGLITNLLNSCIYIACALLFDLQTAIYSLIFAFVCALVTDKLHTQGVNCGVMIITESPRMHQRVMESVSRGVTFWEGTGGHSLKGKFVYYTVVNKFEEVVLRKAIEQEDPSAFVVVSEDLRVYGTFLRRLD
ncbi:MAG: YitT family protein [Angelakisella sp.]|nr:YitT family protein [Angelakisella sp.]MCI9529168.1 YitT family protein [Angelakisella sp.]